MRTIGMLGGMSWESTAEYYRLANELVRERLGGLRSAELLVRSVDFARIERLQAAGDWTGAGRVLAREAAALEAGGADLLVLCTNTMHEVAGALQEAVDVPLLHIVDVTAAAVRAAGASRVGLLGTAFTVQQDSYRERMAAHGVEVVVPAPAQRELVHRVIYDELCRGVVDAGSRAACLALVADLAAAGCEGVVLGCTELELLLRQDDTDVRLFPTTRLHVEAAVSAALEDGGS
ncbi:aspartate/glutamate racemase family protein [Kineococcus sp. SYSU DK004]|uniref:aspartate/glutamate racemase family protein n=1 Tax=Kineococcus sp. SYSU DK004 TaxID=3383125 RepID=UPI003D7F17AF